ncbi:pyridoxamine 5'-phosphate oxidase family protein [Rhizobium sp. TRM96647]|uniref:pyridoxamine 5'-phosphate oxidase family protein n=1 Tax=unclassified Rhizobium TaxID=2613769 RepID=UPI0021E7CC10|nr:MULTISPECIES: pyridoxamine 5'-phosphate oxidase family protein [unclassified Rhizobium]MCV3739270.1 pyridoxamine 5'-phosphate oxidase family protein [Rhizobium sp. TRM96647]MCV3760980.1 pyridoxamine 5'-phosphate oxidase family protein [Rhizobium sp. TRM96650]
MTDLTLQDIAQEMKDIDFVMLSTQSQTGGISARPMSNNGEVEFDGDCWFFSYEDTRKIEDIKRSPAVSLTFIGAPSPLGKPGIFIAVQGDAVLTKDKTVFLQHWTDGLDRWFPDGPDTEGLVLIKVVAKQVDYWDGNENGSIDLAR